MAKKKTPEIRYQCVHCWKVYKSEQEALDCCDAPIQKFWNYYDKWGRGHWYGR